MASRFDQPDDRESTYRRHWPRLAPLPACPHCFMCGREYVAPDHDPYCSSICAVQAQIDSEEDSE